jgi:transcriptional regulator with GAF, ATPase, and Fis domain
VAGFKRNLTSAIIDALTPQTIVRRINHPSGPDIRLAVAKVQDFMEACEAVCRAVTLEDIKNALITTISKQMNPSNCWCCLRDEPSEAMAAVGGKKRSGSMVKRDSLLLQNRIDEVISKQRALLFPRLKKDPKTENIHSAIICPIASENGCYGAVYIDNDRSHEHYNLSDLDYLTLVLIHTAVVIENF